MKKNSTILIVLISVLPFKVFGFVNHVPSSAGRQSTFLPRCNNAPLKQSSSSSSETSVPNATNNITDNPRKTGLALQLDDGTRKSHSFAQNTSFVTSFFKGLSNRQAYANLLTSLYFVYEAMEEVFDTTNDEYVKLMDYGELRRVHSLRKDMEYFHGMDWEQKLNMNRNAASVTAATSTASAIIKPSYATQQYVERIRTVAKENPKLLIAHQYTRYLGDLFGGQMMGGMATKSLNLEQGCGTSFYTFESIDNAQDFITMWYRKLNSLDLTEEEKNAIVDEANLVFDLNIQILQEIEGNAFSAVITLLWKSFRDRIGI